MKNDPEYSNPVILVLFILVLVIATNAYALETKTYSRPADVVSFKLQDQDGKPFDNSRFHGNWTLILFGYTHCPDVCPFTLDNLVAVTEHLSQKVSPGSLPQTVFIGVDPDRDKENLKEYIKHFRKDFVGVTGEWQEIRNLIEALDGFVRLYKKSKDDNAYLVRHSSYVYIVDPSGKLHARMNPPFEPTRTSEFLVSLMRNYKKQLAQGREPN